ncbi:NeuD/PglB/VioB family sugar acetyltransferase [Pseudogemmobacter faecipullorum]|uniref:NeuD/PglB/VioB family sugar acetyltransferase n=1 Tax=Pseudogemmobacter faecipullorum TaxID=2755041 RepID=A0ABS8CGD3_9RHOB|nr:NeuD/PglB/VioB family sugar acetyltransferase [Pseudogemmobacter faecipullorum]MCB5408447.1 NeuD/PglB/VioB family sugar acetyltransferase [Pseudogemmobacter faecipullorum]
MGRGLILIGAGGHAKVVAEAARLSGWTIQGHVAPEAGAAEWFGPWLGGDDILGDDPFRALLAGGSAMALSMGFVDQRGAARRAGVLARLRQTGADLPVISHPAAVISASASIGAGSFIAAGAVVSAAARLGPATIMNSQSLCEHDSSTGENCHIASGARLTGGVGLGRDVLIGAGAVLRQGIRIGAGALVGAGAVVLRDVPPGAMVTGVPAMVRSAGGNSE